MDIKKAYFLVEIKIKNVLECKSNLKFDDILENLEGKFLFFRTYNQFEKIIDLKNLITEPNNELIKKENAIENKRLWLYVIYSGFSNPVHLNENRSW